MTGFYAVPNVIVTYNPNEKALDMKNENGTYLNTSDGKFSSLHVENASYLKLDNMSIGYNFNMAGSEAFRKIRVYATANNVFVITKYTGSDPEVRYTDNAEDNANLNNPLAPGIDRRNTWFMARSFSLGISLGF
jgi:iron complex outermembrane receptor protein